MSFLERRFELNLSFHELITLPNTKINLLSTRVSPLETKRTYKQSYGARNMIRGIKTL